MCQIPALLQHVGNKFPRSNNKIIIGQLFLVDSQFVKLG